MARHKQNNRLRCYTTYTGFAHELDWISLAALQGEWCGEAASVLDDAVRLGHLPNRYPIHLGNSYQARASATRCADGKDGCHNLPVEQLAQWLACFCLSQRL